MASFTTWNEEAYTKVGILLYISVLVAIIGVGVLGVISAIVPAVAAFIFLAYLLKHKIAEKLGINYGIPKLDDQVAI
jgi:hypothetical protein